MAGKGLQSIRVEALPIVTALLSVSETLSLSLTHTHTHTHTQQGAVYLGTYEGNAVAGKEMFGKCTKEILDDLQNEVDIVMGCLGLRFIT